MTDKGRRKNHEPQRESILRGQATEMFPRTADNIFGEMLKPFKPYRLDSTAKIRVAKQIQNWRHLELDEVVSGLIEIFSNVPNKHDRYSEQEVVESLHSIGDSCWSSAHVEQLVDLLNRLDHWFGDVDLTTIAEDQSKRSIDDRLKSLQSGIVRLQAQLTAEQGNEVPLSPASRSRLGRQGKLVME